MKKFLTMLLFGGTALTLSACNTVDGVGEDVESVGDCVDGVEGNC
ncbi:MAG: Entericidin EcnAB [Erythrobacter sp.]|nr:Entericidin EcnAB [Erythrobacter sp.]|tara:strand:+ start:664 stop:798 length:135 start_codon:yes stop_codon:yes gene_type:complete